IVVVDGCRRGDHVVTAPAATVASSANTEGAPTAANNVPAEISIAIEKRVGFFIQEPPFFGECTVVFPQWSSHAVPPKCITTGPRISLGIPWGPRPRWHTDLGRGRYGRRQPIVPIVSSLADPVDQGQGEVG